MRVITPSVGRRLSHPLGIRQAGRRRACQHGHRALMALARVEQRQGRSGKVSAVRARQRHATLWKLPRRGERVLCCFRAVMDCRLVQPRQTLQHLVRRGVQVDLMQAHHVRRRQTFGVLQIEAQARLAVVMLDPRRALHAGAAELLRFSGGEQPGNRVLRRSSRHANKRQIRASLLVKGRQEAQHVSVFIAAGAGRWQGHQLGGRELGIAASKAIAGHGSRLTAGRW